MTGQAIVSDLINVVPNRSSITVNIFVDKENSKIVYTPEKAYYSLPRNQWEGIGNCGVFNCQPLRVNTLLKIVAPAYVKLTTRHIKESDPLLKGLKKPLEKLPPWPNKDSIKVLSDDSLLLKIGVPVNPSLD